MKSRMFCVEPTTPMPRCRLASMARLNISPGTCTTGAAGAAGSAWPVDWHTWAQHKLRCDKGKAGAPPPTNSRLASMRRAKRFANTHLKVRGQVGITVALPADGSGVAGRRGPSTPLPSVTAHRRSMKKPTEVSGGSRSAASQPGCRVLRATHLTSSQTSPPNRWCTMHVPCTQEGWVHRCGGQHATFLVRRAQGWQCRKRDGCRLRISCASCASLHTLLQTSPQHARYEPSWVLDAH